MGSGAVSGSAVRRRHACAGECFRRGAYPVSLGARARHTDGRGGMSARGRWQGLFTIARFNWPYYVAAGLIWIVALLVLARAQTLELQVVCGLLMLGTTWFIAGSLGAAHLIYDRSDL